MQISLRREENASVYVSTLRLSGHLEKIRTLNITCFILQNIWPTQQIQISSLLKESEQDSLSGHISLSRVSLLETYYLTFQSPVWRLDWTLKQTMHFLSSPHKRNRGCSQVQESERLTEVNSLTATEHLRLPGSRSPELTAFSEVAEPLRLSASTG